MSDIYPNQDYQDTAVTEVHATSDYISARDVVSDFVATHQVTTIGRLSREFPQYRNYLMSILNQLRVAGEVYWEDHKPMPTLVYAGNHKTEALINWDKKGH